jgi:hypothetical protein
MRQNTEFSVLNLAVHILNQTLKGSAILCCLTLLLFYLILFIHERGTLYAIVHAKLLSSYNTCHNLEHNKVILQQIVRRRGLMRGVSTNCQNIS